MFKDIKEDQFKAWIANVPVKTATIQVLTVYD